MTTTKLISKLNRLISFDQAPTVDSWNPIKRHRQHKALQQWVDERPPSAGITSSQLSRKYPRNYESERLQKKGAAIGAGAGLGAGLVAAAVGRKTDPLTRALRGITVGAYAVPFATVAGAGIADHKGISKRMGEFNKAHQTLMKELHNDTVPRSSLKLGAPSASTYGEVNRELKKQNVGFLKRHTVATVSRPMVWSNNNAAFLPEGDKGLIITSKKVNPIVAKHEAGHAKDYQHYGGERGFKKAYPEYGNPLAGRDKILSDTLLPEHRAWAYANPRTKKEKEIRDAALTTYRRGMGLSALLDQLIEFGDPRPRNALGEYSSQQEGVADPNDMDKTYGPVKQGLTIGGAAAVGGAGGALGSSAVKGTGKALKHVYDRIKASRVKV